ncbi:L-threonylcarbamoyladenylate synthase [Parapusillimonas granuli]|uniref:Threonylcarbamoyl-AMP synthase n=1 Tax=Parapusillimonas granuli TaxID=380911 RepID=A0A853FZH0_9BURK|nr:L-threonylcarbamoyladenylate synthase [Parapusillimonas granuli]MEB2401448.1 L-threonylcarbamoyladenylate synthase [Alcaligenaceae bacterium]NYT49459.1 threonylcarbamoyl-AMP synthase [Parapusillimonas granuli]
MNASAPDMDQMLDEAARRLAAGGLVAFPTETVYGLGADAENPAAVARIYAAKGRPVGHPIIVHLAPEADLGYWASSVPPEARALIQAFWPGPLTLILPRAPHIPDAVSGGQSSIGLRCPSHPVAQALLRRFAGLKPGGQGGVAAPSANKFGQVSPTHAAHVRSEFPELDPAELLVLEGGPSQVGIESTIVDVSRVADGVGPMLLRPGHVTAAQIAAVLGREPARPDAGAPRASGTLKAHYAPRTPLRVMPRQDIARISREDRQGRIAVVAFEPLAGSAGPGVDWIAAAHEPEAYARELYALLRRLDQQGYAGIVLERPPALPAWQAVNDRIGRAAAAFSREA